MLIVLYFFRLFFELLIIILGAAVCEEISNTAALLLAALLKDFLRSLPEPVLTGNAQEWLNVASSGRTDHLRRLLGQLPRENHMLLAHVICLLYHIAKRSRHNLMSASNLGMEHFLFILFIYLLLLEIIYVEIL